MIPERYSLYDIQKAIRHPKLFLMELWRLYNKIRRILIYRIFYNDWIDHSSLSEKYRIIMSKHESSFAIQHERESKVPDYFQDFSSEYTPSPRSIFKINSGYLCGPQAIPFNASQNPICTRTTNGIEFMKLHRSNFCSDLSSHLQLKTPQTPLSDSVIFPLTGIWDTNYFHWVVEYLPKLRGLRMYERETGRRAEILLMNSPNHWQLEWLELLDIDYQRCMTWNGGIAKVETLILTDHRMQTGGYYDAFDISFDDMNWIRNRALCAVPQKLVSPNKVYISRQATRRRVSNFEDIKKALLQHDYTICQLEDLSVSDQVSLLSSADYIVGVHGAGLVNILFASSDATILELLPKVYNNSHYFRLSQLFDQNYHYLIPDTTSEGELYVDPIKFSNKLSKLQSK